MYKLHHLFISLFLALVVLTCDRNLVKGDSFVVGFSQCTTDSDWRVAMHQAMYRELAFHPEIDLIIKDADSDNEKQVEHIQEFIDDQVDLIIVSPNESDPITPIVEAAVKRDIPVMVLDRRTSSSIYDAYVGGDNYTIGKIAGNYCRRMLEDGGKVLEIWGLTGSSPAIDRHLGFVDEIGKYPDIELAGRISGSWMRDTVKNQLKELVDLYEDVDLVYAHNDIMALGAYEIFKENGLEDKLYIGVDGLLGPTGGIQLVDEGILDATLLYPTGGEDAIRLAAKILKGESYDKENMLQTTVIDSSNVRIMKLQAERIDAQQKDIARQGEKISEQIRLYRTQQIYLVILIASLLLVIILGGIVYASLKANQKVNKELATKNEEVIEMADKAEQATSAQFKFFTNISHEFRTPLTLVLACVDDIISGQKMPSKDANLIKKNAIRLLRLVNQLMDFRKIDNNKMVVHPSHNDFVAFTREIMGSFDRMAIQKKIDYRLIAKEGIIYAYFDENMLDKVLFNLLSNAFKFTEEGGRIHVLIDQLIDNENVILRIEDNGLGMTKDQVKHAFDRFFQAKTHMVKGTGLGLSLSKEIIELHKGKIYVESEKGRGTRFTIILPLNHPELVRSANIELPINIANKSSYSEYLIDLDETATVEKGPISIDPPIVVVEPLSKSNTILIIEDNDDLRKFMAEKLNAKYYVIQADNGIKGLNLALERLPDLIISDIMLPEMDGIEILERVKSDRRTANIPTIILTANDRQEQKVEGLEKGADAYVIKPFNLKRLFATIEQLLNRSSDESNPLSDNPIEEKF